MKLPAMLRRLFIGPILMTGVLAAPGQPALNISVSGNQSVIFWNSTPTNYIVQSATNLDTPNWVTANDAAPVTGVTVSNTSPARFFRLSNPPVDMALIPAGWFTMGNSVGDSDITNANPTNIYVSAFYMDINLVDYGLWTNIYAYGTNIGYSFVHGTLSNFATNLPMIKVDWYDCVKWCNARSQQAGLTPVYYTDAGFTSVFTNGEAAPYANWTANGYRLPTEAEWEKAARGGLSGKRFPSGDFIAASQANYYSTNTYSYDLGPGGPNPIATADGFSSYTYVGSLAANGYGLYDMGGNLFQWCWDWLGTPYGQPTPIDPTGPSTGTYRVMRGGDWSDKATDVRCAYRDRIMPTFGNGTFLGFRCVRRL